MPQQWEGVTSANNQSVYEYIQRLIFRSEVTLSPKAQKTFESLGDPLRNNARSREELQQWVMDNLDVDRQKQLMTALRQTKRRAQKKKEAWKTIPVSQRVHRELKEFRENAQGVLFDMKGRKSVSFDEVIDALLDHAMKYGLGDADSSTIAVSGNDFKTRYAHIVWLQIHEMHEDGLPFNQIMEQLNETNVLSPSFDPWPSERAVANFYNDRQHYKSLLPTRP